MEFIPVSNKVWNIMTHSKLWVDFPSIWRATVCTGEFTDLKLIIQYFWSTQEEGIKAKSL